MAYTYTDPEGKEYTERAATVEFTAQHVVFRAETEPGLANALRGGKIVRAVHASQVLLLKEVTL